MKRWSEKPLHKDSDFIEDGIIDLSHWQKADRKILLLLKEAYGDYGDLCWLIRDEWKGPKYKVWWTASYWLYGLRKMGGGYIPAFPKEQEEFDECKEFLLSAAVVNIKKSRGKSSSDYDDVMKYAREDAELLREQISLINPEIIVCGYTYDYFTEFWQGSIEQVGDTGFVFRTANHILVNYWHPANLYPNELCFYALCAVMKNANLFEVQRTTSR
jgi:hypothetical protein